MCAKPRNLRRNPADRCLLCGLRTTLHFTPSNRKLTCEDARALHPRATVRPVVFADCLDADRPAPRRLTRQEWLEGLADRGCDTWEEYRGER